MAKYKPDLTRAGYLLGAISAVVMFLSAVPVVMWTVQSNVVSKVSAIMIVFLIGPAFFTVAAVILRLFGVSVFKPSGPK